MGRIDRTLYGGQRGVLTAVNRCIAGGGPRPDGEINQNDVIERLNGNHQRPYIREMMHSALNL